MKQGSNTRGRPRGRVGGGGGKRTPNRNQTFDSNGPNVRLRGNAMQLVEKYTALARDAGSQGDRVLSENYYQHADHYHRVYMALTGQSDGTRAATAAQQTGGRGIGADRGTGDDLFGDGDGDTAASPERERTPRATARRGNGQDRDDSRDAEATPDDGGAADGAEETGESQGGPTRVSRAPRRTGRGGARTKSRATNGDDDSTATTSRGATSRGNGRDDEAGAETGIEDGAAPAADASPSDDAEADAAESPARTRRIRRNPRRAGTTRAASGGGDSPESGQQPTAEPSVA
ncbi:DUF4167 domain-containing protein [Roseospira visakhapatnamensis]|uniref:DUF4167 domain-containing protein n=1 Tax=Roseospira visakhapatnamensis TaxID=390880 RepID=A0A7W6RBV1_9PROT|nr:DUF4167 domain-containing protein [Roseospira visakhapatnamensis]MBB4265629.1 hypothetical protein [Roseospira visakhapatnamensis]